MRHFSCFVSRAFLCPGNSAMSSDVNSLLEDRKRSLGDASSPWNIVALSQVLPKFVCGMRTLQLGRPPVLTAFQPPASLAH